MKIFLHDKFKKKLNKLPLKIQEQFLFRLNIFMINPTDVILNNHSVENCYPGSRSININGDYRAIFYIENNVAVFKKVGTHSELYG